MAGQMYFMFFYNHFAKMVTIKSYDAEKSVMEIVRRLIAHQTAKSRCLADGQTDLVIELRTLSHAEPKLIQEIAALDDVVSSGLLRHDGEVTY